MKTLQKLKQSRELSTLLFVVFLFLGVGAIAPDFLSPKNILLVLNGSVVFTMLATGIAFVIISGEIDVSIGATMGMSSAVVAILIRDGASLFAAFAAALAVGLVIGLINGLGTVYLGIPSIIMTLGTNGIVRGFVYVYTGGKWVENIPFEFKALSQATLGGFTYFYLVALALVALIYFVMTRTKKGRYFAAVGDNIGGATLIGIPVKATKMTGFVLCAVFAALSGFMYVSRIGFVTPMAGNGYEMKAIAACVLGGVSLTGGVGSVIGSALGAIIMASIGRILVFLQFSSDLDNTITGVLLITIVVVDALLQRRRNEKARRERLNAKSLAASQAKESGGAA